MYKLIQLEFEDYFPKTLINEDMDGMYEFDTTSEYCVIEGFDELFEMSQVESHKELNKLEKIMQNLGATVDEDGIISFNEKFCVDYSEPYYQEFMKYMESLSCYEFSFGMEKIIEVLNDKYLMLNDVYVHSESLQCSTINFSKLIQTRFFDDSNLLKKFKIVKIMYGK